MRLEQQGRSLTLYLVSPEHCGAALDEVRRSAEPCRVVTLDPPVGAAGVTSLYDYLPENLQVRTAHICDPLLSRWYWLLGAGSLDDSNAGLAGAGAYNLLNRGPDARVAILLCVQNLLQVERPDRMLVSRQFLPYLRACGVLRTENPQRTLLGRLSMLGRVLWYGTIGIVYQLVYKYARARWRDRGRPAPVFLEPYLLCVGEEALLYNLAGELSDALAAGAPIRLLLTMDRFGQKRRVLPHAVRLGARYLESLAAPAEVAAAAGTSFRFLCRMVRAVASSANGRHCSALAEHERRVWLLLEGDVCRFALLAMPMVCLARRLARRLAARECPVRLFVSNPSSWVLEVIRLEMARHGVLTASYTHGLLETALGYRAKTHLFFVLGDFDRRLLQKFHVRCDIRAVGPSAMARLGLPAEGQMRSPPPMKALLLTSSTWASGSSRRREFLSATLEFLDSITADWDFPRITIKLHPFEPLDGLEAEETELHARFPRLAARLTCQVNDLAGAFRDASIVFLMPSTTLLDCLQLDLPFFVFDTQDFDRSTFYGNLPTEVTYRCPEELRARFRARLSDQSLNQHIRELYYGRPQKWQAGLACLRQFLAGEPLESVGNSSGC